MTDKINHSSVSVVISTYNRPDTLAVALRSIELQTRAADEILVIGDSCDDRTAEVVRSMKLSGLRYINLPVRCGEQAIPNAVGTELARSKWVAYLNHDDVWAPDFLSTALDKLKSTGARWYVGHSYFSYGPEAGRAESEPVFTDRTHPNRRLELAFSRSFMYVEPVSSWLVEKSLALEVGNWQPAWKLRRTPTADFALRLFRSIGEPCSSEPPKVFKLPSSITASTMSYSKTSLAHSHFAQLLSTHGRAFVEHIQINEGPIVSREGDLEWCTLEPKRLRRLHQWLRSQNRHGLFLKTGIDCTEISAALLGVEKGHILKKALKCRTGENQLKCHEPRRVIEMVSSNQSQ